MRDDSTLIQGLGRVYRFALGVCDSLQGAIRDKLLHSWSGREVNSIFVLVVCTLGAVFVKEVSLKLNIVLPGLGPLRQMFVKERLQDLIRRYSLLLILPGHL